MRVRFCFISLAAIICLSSCNTPTSVAEKALKLIGLGTFAPTDVDRYAGTEPYAVIMLTSDYGKIFDNSLIKNSEAEFAREHGYYKETPRTAYFNFSDVLFEKYEFIGKEEITTDLYSISNYTSYPRLRNSDLDKKLVESMISIDRRKEDFLLSGDGECGTWLEEKNVPWIILRYKLDNKYIANLSVLKVPDKGYRVCAFRLE